MRPIQSWERCDQFSIVLLSPLFIQSQPNPLFSPASSWWCVGVGRCREFSSDVRGLWSLRAETTRYWPASSGKGSVLPPAALLSHRGLPPPPNPPALYGNLRPAQRLTRISGPFTRLRRTEDTKKSRLGLDRTSSTERWQGVKSRTDFVAARSCSSPGVLGSSRQLLEAAWTEEGAASSSSSGGKPALLPGGFNPGRCYATPTLNLPKDSTAQGFKNLGWNENWNMWLNKKRCKAVFAPWPLGRIPAPTPPPAQTCIFQSRWGASSTQAWVSSCGIEACWYNKTMSFPIPGWQAGRAHAGCKLPLWKYESGAECRNASDHSVRRGTGFIKRN